MGLNYDPEQVIFSFLFFNSTQYFIIVPIHLLEKVCQGMYIPVWKIKTKMAVDFLVMWYLDLLLLSESYWGMRFYTTSLSYSDSAANSFKFWSKVGFVYVSFFLHAFIEFELASLEVVVAELSVNLRFFFLLSLKSSSRDSGQPFPSMLELFYVFQASFFSKLSTRMPLP